MEEFWLDVIDFPNYQVSSNGRVKKKECVIINANDVRFRYKEKILKPELVKGYHRYTFSDSNNQKRLLAHRLVAIHFIDNKYQKKCVNHKNGNKLDNSIDNLEWSTYSENERHSYDTLNKINHNRKLSPAEIDDVVKNTVKNINVDHYMQKYSVCRKTILNILNGKTYTCS